MNFEAVRKGLFALAGAFVVLASSAMTVTSDTAQFIYDQGAIEFTGSVHLKKVDYTEPATPDAKGERTNLDLYADRVTIFLDQERLDKFFNTSESSGEKSGAKAKPSEAAEIAKRRDQIDMLSNLVADGHVFMTNRTVTCASPEDPGTLKAIQSGESAKAVYMGDTAKLVLYGDEAAPAIVRDSEAKSEIEGSKITCWLDITVEGRDVPGKSVARKIVTGVKLKQALVEKSTVTLEPGR